MLKLHWKPTTAEPPPVPSLKQKGSFWNKIEKPQIDANKLVQLFETKHSKEVPLKVSFHRSAKFSSRVLSSARAGAFTRSA